MTGIIRSVYFHQRVYVAVFSLAMIFLFSYWLPVLYIPAWFFAIFLLILIILDLITVYFHQRVYVAVFSLAMIFLFSKDISLAMV